MQFIHIGDLHCNKERLPYCLKSLEIVRDKIKSEKDKPILLIAGDTWDSVITNGTIFYKYVSAIKDLINLTDVYIIYGTSSHDIEGSLDIFKELGANVYRQNTFIDCKDFELVAIPEPRKCDFISSTQDKINKLIKDSMNNFINSLPKKTKTRVVLYHGEVQGAIYQNSQSVTSTPTGLSLKQLQTINADINCFGHIHLPQQIEGIDNAYYCGSCFPKDMGEHHNPSYNLYKVGETIKVDTISFGFPTNISREINLEELEDFCKNDFSNKNLSLKITLNKLLSKNYNKVNLEEEIKTKTNALSVKLHFNYIKVQSTRHKEISEQTSIIEKFKKYSEIIKVIPTDSLINKLEAIQDSLITEKFTPNDRYELIYLSLRGAIGIKDGQGRDEIEINFDDFQDGLIAMTGKTGAGKSTVIENCHPFPQMLTRSGSLKEHFALKDSHRILIYRTPSGKFYKISMFIDGVNKTAPTRFYVETKTEDKSWTSYKACDGTLSSYETFLDSHFGSLQLFLRTSFYAKEQIKGLPDLSKATKGEKMQLFSALAGTDYLSEISEQAKLLKKEEETKKDELKDKYAGFDNIVERIKEYSSEIEEKTAEIKKQEELLKIDTQELELYIEEQKKYDFAILNSNSLRSQLQFKIAEKDETERLYFKLNEEVEQLFEKVSHIDDYKEQLEWAEKNQPIKDNLQKEKETLNVELTQLNSIVNKKHLTYLKQNTDLYLLKNKITKLEESTKALKDSSVVIKDRCPVCNHILETEKIKELRAQQKAIKAKIEDNTRILGIYNEDKIRYELKCQDCDSTAEQKQIELLKNQINSLNDNIRDIDNILNQIDLDEVKSVINYSEPRYKSVKKECKETAKKVDSLTTDIENLEKEIGELPKNYSDKIKQLNNGIDFTKDNISQLKADIRVLKDNLNSLKHYEDDIKVMTEKLDVINSNIKEYEIIQNSFGNNGLQAIELDSAAPEISDVTNVILQETFGDRFTISFDTQRDTKDGRKIDDFIINVFDSETGREKKLDLLSSGESVLVKQALYYAFSVIRTRKTGFCFMTRFLDESDSSLDTELRPKYVRMVEAAHKLCGATHTILITHSQEIKDIVTQKIEL